VFAGVSWLLREDRLPTLKPPVEVLPQVTLTNTQVRWIFIPTAVLLLAHVGDAWQQVVGEPWRC
jgi:hypothetical protein